MKIDIAPDTGAEVILKLQEILNWTIKLKKELSEKDKKILELEEKLKEHQSGS